MLNAERYLERIWKILTGAFGIDGKGTAVSTPPVPIVYNITCVVANTSYLLNLPTNCRGFEFQARTETEVRYAFMAGHVAGSVPPYFTLKAGDYYYSGPINQGTIPSTLYLASSTAGTIVEIIVWN